MSRTKNNFNQLKKGLGESDAFCEYIEVLLRTHEQAMLSDDELAQLAKKVGIRVNSFNTTIMMRTVRHSYFVSVYQHFEAFLKSIEKELNTIGKNASSIPDDGSLLSRIYRHIFGSSNWNTEYGILYQLCEYYRLIRNEGAHGNKKGLAEEFYTKLRSNEEAVNEYLGNQQFPNAPEKIQFDDFILYSRSAKLLAKHMIDFFPYDIESVVKNFDLARFKNRKNDVCGVRKAISHEVQMIYGLMDDELEKTVDAIVDRL